MKTDMMRLNLDIAEIQAALCASDFDSIANLARSAEKTGRWDDLSRGLASSLEVASMNKNRDDVRACLVSFKDSMLMAGTQKVVSV